MGKMRKMRRIMAGVLSLVLVLCMMGCGKTEETGKQFFIPLRMNISP